MRHFIATLPWIGLPLLLAADTLVSLAAGWRPYGSIEALGLLGIALTNGFAIVAILIPTIRTRLTRRAPEAALLLFSAVIAWALLEFGAHTIEKRLNTDREFHTRGPNVTMVFKPHPDLFMGITGESVYTTDRRGIRAPYPPDQKHSTRILCIGGSTTECTYLDNGETWPALLMKELNGGREDGPVWVGNVGVSGYATWQHLAFVEQSPLLSDVNLVVLQPGINDLWRSIAGEEDQIRYDRFEPNAPRESPAPSEENPVETRAPLWTQSRVIQLWHTLRQPDPPAHHVEGVMGEEYFIRRDMRRKAEHTDALPDVSGKIAAYRARIRGIIDACRDRGVKAVFTTQPVLWRDDLTDDLKDRLWFGWTPDGQYLTVPRLRETIDQYNKALREVCNEAGVTVVDLDPISGTAEYFYDDCHFTEAGARAVADRVAPVVRDALD